MYKIQNHKVPENQLRQTHLDQDGYERMYRQSIEQPDIFWAEQANRFVDWMQPWSKVHESNMDKGEAAWFVDAKLNVSVNCTVFFKIVVTVFMLSRLFHKLFLFRVQCRRPNRL